MQTGVASRMQYTVFRTEPFRFEQKFHPKFLSLSVNYLPLNAFLQSRTSTVDSPQGVLGEIPLNPWQNTDVIPELGSCSLPLSL